MTEEIIKRFRREFGEMGLDGFTQTEVEQFILQELSKAKEEGYIKGLNEKIDYDKEGWEELVADEQIKAVDKFKAELREKVEGMKKECDCQSPTGEVFCECLESEIEERDIYNQALSEVLKLLT